MGEQTQGVKVTGLTHWALPVNDLQESRRFYTQILGMEDRIGRVRVGYLADLIVVNGNPLDNLKVLYPTGVDVVRGGQSIHTGGIEWTIKDGIPYHAPTLFAEVKQMVAQARAAQGVKPAAARPPR